MISKSKATFSVLTYYRKEMNTSPLPNGCAVLQYLHLLAVPNITSERT